MFCFYITSSLGCSFFLLLGVKSDSDYKHEDKNSVTRIFRFLSSSSFFLVGSVRAALLPVHLFVSRVTTPLPSRSPGHRRPVLPGGGSHHPGQPEPLRSCPLRLCRHEGRSHREPRGPVSLWSLLVVMTTDAANSLTISENWTEFMVYFLLQSDKSVQSLFFFGDAYFGARRQQ